VAVRCHHEYGNEVVVAHAEERTLPLANTPFTTRVYVAGAGEPVVYFHGASGHDWTGLHDRLAQRFALHAPMHPGWDNMADLDQFDSVADLVLYYVDVLDALGIGKGALVGHSVGGMVAAEVAAMRPDRVSRVALISPWGLWRDDEPVADIWSQSPAELAALLWHDPGGAEAKAHAPVMEPEALLRGYLAGAAAAHFTWPIPDRGLRRRLHRVAAPSLLIWGREDKVVPVSYAADFAALLPDSRTVLFDEAGHNVHLERADAVADAVVGHLAGGDSASRASAETAEALTEPGR
jgi:pimeloyl-ACP methyl ester carboxylesterase